MLEDEVVYSLLLELANPSSRETALLELSKKREAYDDLAPILWHSFGKDAKASIYPKKKREKGERGRRTKEAMN